MAETATPQTPAAAEQRPRRRIKQLETMVADVIPETPDTNTLLLFTGSDRLDYEAGHFLTIDPHQFEALERFIAYFEDAKGKREPPRAYSMASAPHEKYLAITVKEERYESGVTRYPPLLSPLLVKRTLRGMRIVITGFTGPYTLPPGVESKADHVVHVVAGSGAVPNFSILKHALTYVPSLRHTFVCSNKTEGDIIYREPLRELEQRFPDRLKVVHSLTREDDVSRYGPGYRRGRLTPALLRELIPDPRSCLVYACGPAISSWDKAAARAKGEEPRPRFMESALVALAELGVPKERIATESYG
ncbi:MAG TPA: oxidoreductase [Anaeromyxobacteraceae bacterium]